MFKLLTKFTRIQVITLFATNTAELYLIIERYTMEIAIDVNIPGYKYVEIDLNMQLLGINYLNIGYIAPPIDLTICFT
jgi:hypothetical protein